MTDQTVRGRSRQHWRGVAAPLATAQLGAGTPAFAGTAAQPTRVEIILADLSNPFFTHLARQIELSLLRHAPRSEAFDHSSGYDLTRQHRQIRAAGADFLIINAVDSSGVVQPIAEARAAGPPVIAVDVDALGADAVIA